MKQFIKEWRNTILIFAGILIVALLLRLYNLTLLPIFGDEAIYIRWAQVMGAEPGLRFLPLSDGKQPAFMWVLMFLVRRFSDPLFIGRLTSVIYGMVTLVGIFAVSYFLFKSHKVALIASFIWAISPFSLFFDRMALVDAMLTMFGVWTLFFGLLTARFLRLDSAIIAGFTLGGGLITKSPALFFGMMLPATWLLSQWPKDKRKKIVNLSKLVLLLLGTYVIAFGIYNILRLGENFHMLAIRNRDYVFPISHILQSPLDPLLPFLHRSMEWFWMLGPSTLMVLVVAGITFNFKKIPKEISLLGAWLFIPLVISAEYAKVFTTRYVLFVFPYVSILAASAFSPFIALAKKGLAKKYRGLLKLLFIIFIVHALWIDRALLTNPEAAPLPRTERSGYLEGWTAGTGIAEVAEIIRQEHSLTPDEKIVVGTEGHFGPLPDGLQAYLNDLPEITVIGVGLELDEIPESLRDSSKVGNRTYLVANSSRVDIDINRSDVELVAVYPKAFRPDGSRDSLYFLEIISD